MQILSQGNFFVHVVQLRVLFQNLLNPVPKVRVLASQVTAGHGRFPMCPFAS
jgi:hypothetical protein